MGRSAQSNGARTSWDFALIAITVALMGALGVQSLVGTLYTWWAYANVTGWEQSGQPQFIATMNAVAAPLVVALVVVMGLCVPKRLLSRRTLVVVSAGMVAAGGLAAIITRSVTAGLTVYLCAAAAIQVVVVVLTLAGTQGLRYLSENRVAKAGSGLLHLGFIVAALVIVALQRSAAMLPVSLLAAALLTIGSGLAFYARSSSRAAIDEETAG